MFLSDRKVLEEPTQLVTLWFSSRTHRDLYDKDMNRANREIRGRHSKRGREMEATFTIFHSLDSFTWSHFQFELHTIIPTNIYVFYWILYQVVLQIIQVWNSCLPRSLKLFTAENQISFNSIRNRDRPKIHAPLPPKQVDKMSPIGRPSLSLTLSKCKSKLVYILDLAMVIRH